MLRRQSPEDAAASPGGGGPALGGRGCHCGEVGDPPRSLSPVGTIPGPSHLPREMQRGCGFGDRPWVQAGTGPGGAFLPDLCLGTLRRIWGAAPAPPGAAGTDPPRRGCGGGSGEPRRVGTLRGSPGPFPRGRGGQTALGSGGWRRRGRRFRCREQRPQRAAFQPQNERGERGRAGPCPKVRPVRGAPAWAFLPVSLLFSPWPGAGARVWLCLGRGVRGAEPVRVYIRVCV